MSPSRPRFCKTNIQAQRFQILLIKIKITIPACSGRDIGVERSRRALVSAENEGLEGKYQRLQPQDKCVNKGEGVHAMKQKAPDGAGIF
jgi:hypothetical protein